MEIDKAGREGGRRKTARVREMEVGVRERRWLWSYALRFRDFTEMCPINENIVRCWRGHSRLDLPFF